MITRKQRREHQSKLELVPLEKRLLAAQVVPCDGVKRYRIQGAKNLTFSEALKAIRAERLPDNSNEKSVLMRVIMLKKMHRSWLKRHPIKAE